MKIKFVNDNTLDVFIGKGWMNWSRFEVKGTYLKKTGGANLSQPNMSMLKERLFKHG